MNKIDKLSEYFAKFPGIGPRQAKRFVYFLLKKDDRFLQEMAENILNLKKNIKTCQSCNRFFQGLNSDCEICSDDTRDNSVLMIVGKDADLENIEKNNIYNGKYFVIGGYLPIMSDAPPSWLKISELERLVEKEAKAKNLKEIIIALSLNPEGENTIYYINQILKPLTEKYKLQITTLGKGLSTGTELEYSDDETLKNALKNRG